MNFKEPVSTFAYNLISLHHDIMWYIFIILTIVYWCLYKIIKEYSWNTLQKQEGSLLSFLNSLMLFKIQRFVIYLWINVFIYNIFRVFTDFIYVFEKTLDRFLVKGQPSNNIGIKFINFILGKGYYTGLYYNFKQHISPLSLNLYEDIILQRFFYYHLFNKSSNAVLLYDGHDNILKTLKFKHSINLEYVFGIFPTVIIGFIIVPSMYLLYSNETDLNPGLTIKVIGHQWYWSYESYSAQKIKESSEILYSSYNFDSIIINEEKDLIKGGKRLLETDTALVLPYNVIIRFLITSSDVLHAWALPEMGIKVDAVPGRLNQVVSIPSNLGIFYGQCSELCGVSHGFMPIKVNVITLTDYLNLFLNK